MTPKRKRLWLLLASLATIGAAVSLVLVSLSDNLVFFYSPTQIADKRPPPERRVRIGGLVEAGSVAKPEGLITEFVVTDLKHSVKVTFRGQLPDLFREGQGVIAEGSLRSDGVFEAREVLAKHDESYMPPEVAKALKDAGMWKDPKGAKK